MMVRASSRVVVDSNVILDVINEDETWFAWSSEHLAQAAESAELVINPIIFAEVSIRFDRIEDARMALRSIWLTSEPISEEAAFLAGKCYEAYRRRGGQKRSPLPDFFIGAHAAIGGMSLLTRDATRYRTYFPQLVVVAPGE